MQKYAPSLLATPILLLAALVVACGGAASDGGGGTPPDDAGSRPDDASSDAASVAPEAAESRETAFGVAGVIPRNFPNATDDDWVAMFESLAETGPLLGAFTNWYDDPTKKGEIPNVLAVVSGGEDRYSYTAVIGVGFHLDDDDTTSTVDWTDPAEIAAFTETMVAIASEFEPGFFFIGGEINRWQIKHVEEFEGFRAAWPALYAAVKQASPRTQVGTIYQLEMMRGEAYLVTGAAGGEPQWGLLDGFVDAIDVVGYTSYPFLNLEDPADIPADYFADAAARAGAPIALTEVGWPSRPLSSVPDSGYGGSPEEQVAFTARLLELIEGVDMRFALWSFQYDIGLTNIPGAVAFESVSLRENDGTPKPALSVWAATAAG